MVSGVSRNSNIFELFEQPCLHTKLHLQFPPLQTPLQEQETISISTSLQPFGTRLFLTVDLASVASAIKTRSIVIGERFFTIIAGGSSTEGTYNRSIAELPASSVGGWVVFILSLLFPGVVVESSFFFIPSCVVTNAAKPVEDVSKHIW